MISSFIKLQSKFTFMSMGDIVTVILYPDDNHDTLLGLRICHMFVVSRKKKYSKSSDMEDENISAGI